MAEDTSSTTAETIDVLACSAPELVTFLMEQRFDNDGMATTAFLLEGVTTMPNADEIAAQIAGASAEETEEEENGEEEEESDGATKKEEEAEETVVALVSSQSEDASPTTAVSQQSTTSTYNLGADLHMNPIELSLTNPRGKFELTFCEEGVQASTVKNPQTMIISNGAVRNMIVFPKPTDCQFISSASKKATISPMILLCFHDKEDGDDDDNDDRPTVTFKDKPLSQICFSLPLTLCGSLECALEQAGIPACDSTVEDAWVKLLSHSLQISDDQIFRIVNPNTASSGKAKGWAFQSYQEANTSSTAGNLPFVKTYFGVQDGCLFPMEQGLLFFKPPLFIPRSKLHSIACGRGNGASSRYVDMHITLDDDTAMEFTNISREELSVLNSYIHKILIPAMQRDQSQDYGDGAVAVVAKTESASMSSDQDSDDEALEVVKVEGGRGRSKRKAAREASQQTKQHYQKHKGDDESDEEENAESSDDEAFDGADNDTDEESSDDEDFGGDDDDDSVKVAKATKKGSKKGNQVDSEKEEEDEEVAEEDIAETDTEEEETGDDDDEEASPPPSKKSRSKK